MRGTFSKALATAFAALCLTGVAYANPHKAASFYEDALRKFEQDDVSGSIIQVKNALQQDTTMLSAYLLLGRALLRKGDVKGAEAAFEESLKLGVSRSEVVIPLGEIYLALGNPEFVVERIAASGWSPALQVEVLSMRGIAFLELGDIQQAIQSFKEARLLDPQAVAPLLAEIPMLLRSGQYPRAKINAAKAITLAPNNEHAWNMHASVLHATFDLPGALAAYDKALSLKAGHIDARVARASLLLDLKRETHAREDLAYLEKTAAGEPRAAYLRAVLAGRKGDERGVGAALNEVVKLIDVLSPTWLSRREQLLMLGALAHYGLGNWEKARAYANRILARNSGHFAASKLLASIYVDTKEYSRALLLLKPLAEIAPDDAQVQFLLGSVHLAQNRFEQASELLEKAARRMESPDVHRAFASSQLELDRGDRGVATLEKLIAKDPGDYHTGTKLAIFYIRQGQMAKAVRVGEAMARATPDNLAVLNFLGIVRVAAGDNPGARDAYTRVLTKAPSFRSAALNLAKLDSREGRFDDSRRRLTHILAREHEASDVLFELGLLEQRAGRYTEAARHLRKADEVQRGNHRPGLALIELQLGQRQFEEASAVAKDLSARYPDTLVVQLALARTYLASGNRETALSVLHQATRVAGYDVPMQLRIAQLQLAAANADGAYYSVHKALQANPDHRAGLALMVEIQSQRGDAAKADTALRSMSAKHPHAVETAQASGYLAMKRGRYAAAAAAYRIALSREPSTDNALNVARAFVAGGEASKAAEFLEQWIKNQPKDIAVLKALAEVKFRSGQLAAAREDYMKAIAVVPDDATTLNNFANLLQRLSDPAAKVYAERAVKLEPHNAEYADTLGWILVNTGDVERGLRHLQDARLRSPDNGEIRFHLAFALTKAGRAAEARKELAAAIGGPRRVEDSAEVIHLRKALQL